MKRLLLFVLLLVSASFAEPVITNYIANQPYMLDPVPRDTILDINWTDDATTYNVSLYNATDNTEVASLVTDTASLSYLLDLDDTYPADTYYIYIINDESETGISSNFTISENYAVQGCMELSIEGATYEMTNNISFVPLDTGTCITFTSNNVTFDCKNYLMSSEPVIEPPPTDVNYITVGQNTIVQNCNIKGNSDNNPLMVTEVGINIPTEISTMIENTTITNISSYAILANGVGSNVTIKNSNIIGYGAIQVSNTSLTAINVHTKMPDDYVYTYWVWAEDMEIFNSALNLTNCTLSNLDGTNSTTISFYDADTENETYGINWATNTTETPSSTSVFDFITIYETIPMTSPIDQMTFSWTDEELSPWQTIPDANYTEQGFPTDIFDNAIDGDYATYASNADGESSVGYANYTIPSGWEIMEYQITQSYPNSSTPTSYENVSIPSDCNMSSPVSIELWTNGEQQVLYCYNYSSAAFDATIYSNTTGLLTGINDLRMFWTNNEYRNETDFKLWQYDAVGGWVALNSTPDTTNNQLSIFNFTPASDYGILEGDPENQTLLITINTPINTTYENATEPVSIPYSITCSGTVGSYLLNITIDDTLNISDAEATNGTAYTGTFLMAFGSHNISAECWNGTTSNISNVISFTVSLSEPPTPEPSTNPLILIILSAAALILLMFPIYLLFNGDLGIKEIIAILIVIVLIIAVAIPIMVGV